MVVDAPASAATPPTMIRKRKNHTKLAAKNANSDAKKVLKKFIMLIRFLLIIFVFIAFWLCRQR
jgi:hypothetical protein